MTNFEKNQNEKVFIQTGKTAFLMMINFFSPYKDQPFKGLWERGYKIAKKRFYDKRPLTV